MKMKKMKLLTAILFCLGIAGMASATEVINIDLNGYGNTVAYNGFTDIGTNIWRAYYGGSNPEGWGKAMGSPRTNNLANYDEPNKTSTYEAQVWIGDNNATVPHGWIMGDGNGLWNDGFKKSGGPADPNPSVVLWGKDAYAGTYDLYLLGEKNTTIFKVTSPAHNYGTLKADDDGVAEFDDVVIGAYDANVTVVYDSNFYGIQLVKKLRAHEIKDVVTIHDPTCGNENDWMEVNAPEYDVAYETNTRSGEIMLFGPDFELNGAVVGYLDSGEYMKYDIYVAPADAGYYNIDALVNTFEGKVNSLQIYIDDVLFGSMYDVNDTSASAGLEDYFWISSGDTGWPGGFQASGNLFAGYHTLEWKVPSQQYFNIQKLRLLCVGPVVMHDCNDVYKYNFNNAMDFTHDCHVDFKDLALIATNWANCYSPDPNDCP
jgi:hypothetical protein